VTSGTEATAATVKAMAEAGVAARAATANGMVEAAAVGAAETKGGKEGAEAAPKAAGGTAKNGPGTTAAKAELELELIQPHMAQKPVLRGEVGCACVEREVSVERGGMGESGCARRLGGWVRRKRNQ